MPEACFLFWQVSASWGGHLVAHFLCEIEAVLFQNILCLLSNPTMPRLQTAVCLLATGMYSYTQATTALIGEQLTNLEFECAMVVCGIQCFTRKLMFRQRFSQNECSR